MKFLKVSTISSKLALSLSAMASLLCTLVLRKKFFVHCAMPLQVRCAFVVPRDERPNLIFFPGHMTLTKKGTLHRDVSAENIVLGKPGAEPGNRGVLIDFDLATHSVQMV
jgi:serine/threonine protein kinase